MSPKKARATVDMADKYHGNSELRAKSVFTPPGKTCVKITSFGARRPNSCGEH